MYGARAAGGKRDGGAYAIRWVGGKPGADAYVFRGPVVSGWPKRTLGGKREGVAYAIWGPDGKQRADAYDGSVRIGRSLTKRAAKPYVTPPGLPPSVRFGSLLTIGIPPSYATAIRLPPASRHRTFRPFTCHRRLAAHRKGLQWGPPSCAKNDPQLFNHLGAKRASLARA